jgi:hypothetical protein
MNNPKYLKYKKKYLDLKSKIGGGNIFLGPPIKFNIDNLFFINKITGDVIKPDNFQTAYNLLHSKTYKILKEDDIYVLYNDDGYFAHFKESDNCYNLYHDDDDDIEDNKNGNQLVSEIKEKYYNRLKELFNSDNLTLKFDLYKDPTSGKHYVIINNVIS